MPEIKVQNRKLAYYRGLTEPELAKLTIEEYVPLLPARARRRLQRTNMKLSESHKRLITKGQANKAKCTGRQEPQAVKTHCRDTIITPEMLGCVYKVHCGDGWYQFKVNATMIGMQFADFGMTYVPVRMNLNKKTKSRPEGFIPIR